MPSKTFSPGNITDVIRDLDPGSALRLSGANTHGVGSGKTDPETFSNPELALTKALGINIDKLLNG